MKPKASTTNVQLKVVNQLAVLRSLNESLCIMIYKKKYSFKFLHCLLSHFLSVCVSSSFCLCVQFLLCRVFLSLSSFQYFALYLYLKHLNIFCFRQLLHLMNIGISVPLITQEKSGLFLCLMIQVLFCLFERIWIHVSYFLRICFISLHYMLLPYVLRCFAFKISANSSSFSSFDFFGCV